MSKKITVVFLATFTLFGLIFFIAKNKQQNDQELMNPKLVVGIVVDQMRADYLYRFSSNYTERGFKRLLREGLNFRNVKYNYIPTKTGPGHASIFTGTTPSVHGVVSNEWHIEESQKEVNCVEDPSVRGVGGKHKDQPSYSPKNLLATTVSDELKLVDPQSKTIGISFKNRGAILPVGHTADYAFWYDKTSGQFVSSTYYVDVLPQWLAAFNQRGYVQQSIGKEWVPKLSIKKYTHSRPDDSPFEKVYSDKKKSTFPYKISDPKRFSETPYANVLLTELAKEAIDKESLGQDEHTDFLSISYSATDAIGHLFGIRSKEVEDTYVWLDLQIAALLEALDRKVGKGNYLLFLTADHGAVDHPGFLAEQRIPSGSLSGAALYQHINQHFPKLLRKHRTLISHIGFNHIYLSKSFKQELLQNPLLARDVLRCIGRFKGIRKVFWAEELDRFCTREAQLVRHGYYPRRCGDIYVLFEPGWVPERAYGTLHGTHYPSDTHIPLLWYGVNIPKGKTVYKSYEITDIAPTLSTLLQIPLPAASSGKILEEAFHRDE